MNWAYDLDGVLAEEAPKSHKVWGKMVGEERDRRKAQLLDHYRKAKVLLEPEALSFIVITARKDETEIRTVTWTWLRSKFGPRVKEVYMLSKGRTLKNVIEHKSYFLGQHGITDYVEDNVMVLKGIRAIMGPGIRLWHYSGRSKLMFPV